MWIQLRSSVANKDSGLSITGTKCRPSSLKDSEVTSESLPASRITRSGIPVSSGSRPCSTRSRNWEFASAAESHKQSICAMPTNPAIIEL